MTETTTETTLLAGPGKTETPTSEMVVLVARAHGTSPFKQAMEMIRARRGDGKVRVDEYYAARVYRPELSAEEKRQFVGRAGSRELNDRLSPHALTGNRAFIGDKTVYGELMRSLGFDLPVTQAIVNKDRGLGTMTVLSDAEAFERFLREDAVYPLFTKPEWGSGSIGSALISDVDRDTGDLMVANGTRTPVGEFVRQCMEAYPDGMVLQHAIQQHPDVEAIIGKAVGCLRLVTVIEDTEPRLLYALWKIPSPSAMSDNAWQSGSITAAIDAETGEIIRTQRGTGNLAEELDAHPVSGKPLVGFTIPNWDKIVKATTEAHKVFPEFGVFGFDVAIGPEGAVIVECNTNPHHTLYQFAHDRPLLNPEFTEVFDRIAARAGRLQEARIERRVRFGSHYGLKLKPKKAKKKK